MRFEKTISGTSTRLVSRRSRHQPTDGRTDGWIVEWIDCDITIERGLYVRWMSWSFGLCFVIWTMAYKKNIDDGHVLRFIESNNRPL